ncbi:E3 ubiquitin-protein ligase RING1 [Artemisia annua]|uniref:RING-type E3 ubiquitin transferase n=1 Tax=Artemisia annua TaxID=35608 RepID=A0A2U1M0I2_ARTAN|nr:E3 ubiquitin-protein ligase RING1 [Artemisia annua]
MDTVMLEGYIRILDRYDAICMQYQSRPDKNVPTWVHRCIQDIERIAMRIAYSQQIPADGGSTTGDDIICAICMDEYREDDKTGTLGCQHVYHAQCIKSWLICKNNCPMCRTFASIVVFR